MMRCQSAKWCRAARVGVSLAFVALGQVGDAAALSLVCGDEDEPYHEDRALQVRPMHQGRLSNIESPLSGDVEVALNARIWGGFHSGEVRLVGPEGEVESERHYLPLGGLTSGGDGLPLLTPREPLLPDTQYRVDAEYDWGEGLEPEQHSWQFTTGTRVDLEPPPLPLIVTETGSSDVRLDLTFEGILVGEPEPSPGTAESLAELLMPLGFEHGEWPRDPADPLLRWITQRSTIFLGSHSCGWPLGRRSSARFGVFDGAGNFSGWTSVTELALPAAPPGVEPGPDDLSSAFPPAEQSAAQERDAGPSACSLHGGSSQRRGWAWWPGALLALAISRRAARAPQLLTPTPFQPKPISRLRIG